MTNSENTRSLPAAPNLYFHGLAVSEISLLRPPDSEAQLKPVIPVTPVGGPGGEVSL